MTKWRHNPILRKTSGYILEYKLVGTVLLSPVACAEIFLGGEALFRKILQKIAGLFSG